RRRSTTCARPTRLPTSTRTWRPPAFWRISLTKPRSAAGSCSRRAARPSDPATSVAVQKAASLDPWPGPGPARGALGRLTEDAGQRAASIVWSAVLVPSVVDLAMTPSRDIARLLEIMAALRTPGTGCPWDLEQTFGTIAPYTIEEAYEVADAIARGDLDDLR